MCSNVPAQSIVQTALWGYQSVKTYVNADGRITKQKDYIVNALNSIPGISVVEPKAAFYCFPKIDVEKFNITDDMQFALDFLKKERVLLVQGTGFNYPEPDHFRVVYLPRIAVLEESVQKLERFLSTYRQN